MTALFNYPERQNVVKNACDLIIENEIIREEELRFYNIIIALFFFCILLFGYDYYYYYYYIYRKGRCTVSSRRLPKLPSSNAVLRFRHGLLYLCRVRTYCVRALLRG